MTIKAIVPIEIDESNLISSGIPEPDISVGEEAWLSLEDRRDINIIDLPVGAVRTEFGMYYDDTIHDDAIWFSVMDYALFDDWYFVGMDASFSVIFSESIPKPTASPNLKLCGFFIRSSNAFFFWWDSVSKNVSIASATISGSGSPSFNPTHIALTGLPSDHSSNNGYRIFSGGTNESYIIVASSSYTESNPFDRVTSERLCILDVSGNEIARKTLPNTQFGTITDIAMIGSLIYVTRVSGLSDNPYVGEIYNLSLELVASSPLNKVVSGARFIGVGSNGTVNITNNETNPSFEVLKASDFSPVKSYYIGDEVVYLPNHKKYYCLKDNSLSAPPESSAGDSSSEWLLVGPSNRFAMFDTYIKNKTKSSSDFTVEITPGDIFDTVSFFGVVGVDSIRVEVLRGTDVIYDETKSFVDENSIVDWYSYFFYQLTHREEDVFFNVPPHVDTNIRATFTGTGTGIEVGVIPLGMSQSMGVVCVDTSSNTKDYSDIEYDQFGELNEIERPVVSYNTYQIDVKKTLAKSIERKLKDLRGKNALWVGDIGDDQQLITYGRYERSPLTYSNHSIVSYSVKVRGSI